jgi:ATP-dependent helicase/nuclease subunit A
MKPLTDQSQREQALDPHRSFIVQAPAGSGKTELLVQRFLVLLANAQQVPEEIVAITFTRKAAAEMRDRVLQALANAAAATPVTSAHAANTQKLAQLVIQRDRTLNWNLLQNPNRLRINTIDSLCLSLVRQMPLLAKLGTQPQALLDAKDCYSQAVQTLLNNFTGQEAYAPALEILLSHLDNHYGKAKKLLMDMLAHRDQWLPHVLQALQTKNSAKLRDILQQGLANTIVERIQNCRQLFPAHLQAIFLTLVRFASEKVPPHHPLQACRDLQTFPDPLIAEQQRWHALALFLLTKEDSQWRKQATIREGFPADKNSHYQSMKQAMLDLLAELRQDDYHDFRQALQQVCEAPPPVYTNSQWQVVDALVELLPVLAAELQLVFQERNGVDFVGIASAAIQALGEAEAPSQLALHLDYQIRHLLVDEFQDTSLTQFRLLELLTAGWQVTDGRTLFLVGDPMQSIYRFRQAEVGLFLRARQQGIGAIPLESLVLSVNFRANTQLINWINATFTDIFPTTENIAQGAIRYAVCEAIKPAMFDDGVSIQPLIEGDAEQEAIKIIEIIQQRQAKYPEESIGILVRSRSHLQTIVPTLQNAGLAFQAVEIEKLSEQPIMDDLFALTRALFHVADRTAWLAILRAPWCGLTLADLHILANPQQPTQLLWQAVSRYQELSLLSQDAQQRLQRVVPVLNAALAERGRSNSRQWVEGTWMALGGPASLEDEADLHYAHIYFGLLDEVGKGGHTLDIDALTHHLANQYTTPPQMVAAQIHVMTIHKAKGLEFDCVILPGLDHRQRQECSQLLMWLERPRAESSDLILAPISAVNFEDPIYKFLSREQQQKNEYELVRLLYVAITRARKKLYLLGNARLDPKVTDKLKSPVSGSFLGVLWPKVQQEFTQRLVMAPGAPLVIMPKPLTPALQRLKADWNLSNTAAIHSLAILPTYTRHSPAVLPNVAIDLWARLIGNVVHSMLQKMSQQDLKNWHKDRFHEQRKFWQKTLLEQGMPSAKLATALDTIQMALLNTLHDARGRWLIDNNHQDAHSEYPVSMVLNDDVLHLVIDRTFIAEDGTRWVIDYKTATPNSDVGVFLDVQQQLYQLQLQRYAQAMYLLDAHHRPIRLGLYFPLCKLWREWPAEIMAAV